MKQTKSKRSIYIQLLIIVSIAAELFHFAILFKLIPYDITWGGRLKSDSEMYVFEGLSILVNAFFIFTLLQKGEYVKSYFSMKAVSIILWVFFGIFFLNTIGNLFAKTTFEKGFTILTFVNSILLWRINKKTSV
jgi:hypothetical protein